MRCQVGREVQQVPGNHLGVARTMPARQLQTWDLPSIRAISDRGGSEASPAQGVSAQFCQANPYPGEVWLANPYPGEVWTIPWCPAGEVWWGGGIYPSVPQPIIYTDPS